MITSTAQTMANEAQHRQHMWIRLHFLYLLAMLIAVAAVLTAAMVFQYGEGELPCPLCLLQRVAMLGVCFGLIIQFRFGLNFQNSGISLLFATCLLIVSVRQTLLDIYLRPGHDYIGSAVFGLHMPVWSILIALALIIATALQMMMFGGGHYRKRETLRAYPLLRIAALSVSLYVIGIAAINLVSVAVQCGLDTCHTDGYALLK